jgi:cerevisin
MQAAAIVAAGIFLGVAAGNEAMPADYYSPASEPSVCTVGAVARNETLIEWSNYGSQVDILAPGVEITSTLPNGEIGTFSGTSMAAPHVVGLAAYLLGLGSSSDNLCGTIAALATKNAIDQDTLPEGTPNLLAFNGAAASQM